MVLSLNWELYFLEGEVKITVWPESEDMQQYKLMLFKTALVFHYLVLDLSLMPRGIVLRVFLNFGVSCRDFI